MDSTSSFLLRALLQSLMVLIMVAVLVLAFLWDRDRPEVVHLDQTREWLERRIESLRLDNRRLQLVVDQLRDPRRAAELVAREKLGYLAPGEQVYLDPEVLLMPEEGDWPPPSGPGRAEGRVPE